ncbi:M15 family metallopeptidase [Paenibacillus sp. BR2-3]|uniref:M15 family metallopeptidase n=1 Tax=Paenibacillus sp. BR2-3 TaxID=3048494 RepID=UPI00397798BA
MSKKLWIPILFIVVIAAGWVIGEYTTPSASQEEGTSIAQQPSLQGAPAVQEPSAVVPSPSSPVEDEGVDANAVPTAVPATAEPATAEPATAKPAATAEPASGDKGSTGNSEDSEQTAAEPESLTVLVNKLYKLPDNYKPADLVYPEVPFIFSDKIEKRMLRKSAAKALEEMFAGARKDGVNLAGVSAFRSQSTQTTLFNRYVKRDGEAKARTYSAVPGHSEHQTGLAIDISGSDGKCAAESCFAGTKEADWLAKYAPDYGYIIRFPEGKESITGYKYEPWHIRYVGTEIARSVAERGITLEEYYDAIPVSR